MAWVLLIFWFAVFIFLMKKMRFFQNSGLKTSGLIFVFGCKVVAGTILTLIYTYYYTDRSTADIYKYFDDARVIASALPDDPNIYLKLMLGVDEESAEVQSFVSQMHNWSAHSEQWLTYTQTRDLNFFSSNRIITRFNALLWPVTLGNMFTHVLFMCFFSLLGLVALFRQMNARFPEKRIPLLLVIFFMPSLLLWCSGVLKDSLIIAALYLLIFLGNKLVVSSNKRVAYLLLSLALLIILLLTKYYVVLALIPGILGLLLHHWKTSTTPFIAQSLAVGICLIGLMASTASEIGPDGISILRDKREEALKAAILGNAQHTLFVDNADPGILGFVKKIPEAMLTGLFRPYIWETNGSPFILLSALENLLLILLVLATVFYGDKRFRHSAQLWLLLSFSLCLAFIIGYTTPVSGGLVRYKTAFLPALGVSLCLLIDFKRWPYADKRADWSRRISLRLFNS